MTLKQKISAAALIPVLALGMTACSEEKAAKVSKSADSNEGISPFGSTGEADTEDSASDESTDVVEGEGAESEEAEPTEEPAPTTANIGDTVEVGDWSVKITESQLNANQILAAEDLYNNKPKGQYVLFTFEATYNGSERTASAGGDLSWSFTGSDQQIVDQSFVTTISDSESWPREARKGGTVKQQVAFDVTPNLIKGGILSVEGYDENYDTVFADFAIE